MSKIVLKPLIQMYLSNPFEPSEKTVNLKFKYTTHITDVDLIYIQTDLVILLCNST